VAAVTEAEVVPGLVVHLDTDELRRIGGASTNAEVSRGQDRAVVGPHYFLVVAVAGGLALAVPLFSRFAPGSELLEESLKSGLPAKWLGEDSYFSRWQHWRIPVTSVAAASDTEESSSQDRRRYAVRTPASLAAIASWQARNRAPYRAL
jgi:hypothetical protein